LLTSSPPFVEDQLQVRNAVTVVTVTLPDVLMLSLPVS
jgi:hypothetical protein